jgi:hypothetical protein
LETYYKLNLLLDELLIFYNCKLAFAQFGTGLTNFFGLLMMDASVIKKNLNWRYNIRGKNQ